MARRHRKTSRDARGGLPRYPGAQSQGPIGLLEYRYSPCTVLVDHALLPELRDERKPSWNDCQRPSVGTSEAQCGIDTHMLSRVLYTHKVLGCHPVQVIDLVRKSFTPNLPHLLQH